MLQYCAACQSAVYCSKACQRKDWKKQHKQICKLLNVGHGDMQVRCKIHTDRQIHTKETFESGQRNLNEDMERFFKLFEESTFYGSQTAAREMTKITKRQIKDIQKILFFHSLQFLTLSRFDSEMLSWPNSPLLVMLQFVDPSAMPRDEHARLEEGSSTETPLHTLSEMANTSDYSTHEKQLILAKQLIEHGANVNAVSIPDGATPLQMACSWSNVTNLDFVELLLEAGADPNAQDHRGKTPLMYTVKLAPGTAKFLLNWPTTDANITDRSGVSILTAVQVIISLYSDESAQSDNPEQVQHQFLLRQWIGIKKMLVERRAVDTGRYPNLE
jgi:hypothetical protein